MGETDGRGHASRWEWVAAAISSVLVLGMIGVMLHEGFQAKSPPDIHITVDSVIQAGGGFVVQFRARNDGGETAAGLNVEGELSAGGESVEKSEVTIDYVPRGAHRGAALWFREDPRRYHLEIRPRGHDVP